MKITVSHITSNKTTAHCVRLDAQKTRASL